jgi:long-chain acyl-CoA synthetase
MDEDGYVYFLYRIKRMIVTNGYNVYPAVLEAVLDRQEGVDSSCVIGIPDERRGQRIRACVILQEGVPETEETKERLMEGMRKEVARYALPKEIVFRKEFPRTLVGKIAYHQLEEEA